MYLFIAIILIAELIIAVNIICLIVKWDKKAVALNEKITQSRPKLQETLSCMKESVGKFVLGVHNLCEFARRQREKYIISAVQNVLIYLLLIFLKGRSKRCLSAMQLALSLKDCWTC